MTEDQMAGMTLKVRWLMRSSSLVYCFGIMSRRTLIRRWDRAAELYGRGPRFFSSHLD